MEPTSDPAVQRRVVCAANRSKATGQIVCGARHYDKVMREQVGSGTRLRRILCALFGVPLIPRKWLGADQGFIDQFCVWMNRQEAWKVAEAAGQIRYDRSTTPRTLFSEDLY